jgi:hypothetical protein
MKLITSKILLFLSTLLIAGAVHAGPTAADVGDAQTFGHPALYMGAASGFVTLSDVCDPMPSPTPPATVNDNQCFVINPVPASTTVFVANDICRIKLPKKATRNVIYPAINMFINYQLHNTTGADQPSGLFTFSATLTIESDALLGVNDPDGNPYNGKLEGQFPYNYRDDRSMKDGDRQRLRETLVRVGNTGITKAQLVSQGVPTAVVDAMFIGPMTIRMSVTGSARLIDFADITGNMRLFGD